MPPVSYVVACPRCAALHRSWSRSGNTLGATLWSDGKVVGPMVPTPAPEIVRCAGCARFFWLRDGVTWWPRDEWAAHELRLEAVGPQRARVLQALRQHLGLGIMQADALARQAPVTLLRDEPRERARALADALQAAGATARWGPAGQAGQPLPAGWEAAPFVAPLGEDGLLQALDAGACAARADEVSVRREIWWLAAAGTWPSVADAGRRRSGAGCSPRCTRLQFEDWRMSAYAKRQHP